MECSPAIQPRCFSQHRQSNCTQYHQIVPFIQKKQHNPNPFTLSPKHRTLPQERQSGHTKPYRILSRGSPAMATPAVQVSTRNPLPQNPNLKPLTPSPNTKSSTPHPNPQDLSPQPSTLNPQPSILNRQPSTLNPQLQTPNRNAGTATNNPCALLPGHGWAGPHHAHPLPVQISASSQDQHLALTVFYVPNAKLERHPSSTFACWCFGALY